MPRTLTDSEGERDLPGRTSRHLAGVITSIRQNLKMSEVRAGLG